MMKKRSFAKNTWHGLLIIYIPKPIKESVTGAKEKS